MEQTAVIYARLSAAKDESVSIAQQVERCEQLAEASGWRVVGVGVDDGVSGSVPAAKRPGWGRVLEALDRNPGAVVLALKVDRLSRSTYDFLALNKQVIAHGGAGLRCVADPVDMSTPQGRAFATVLAVFAELERESISARVKAARAQLLKEGRRAGGRPPFGWQNVPSPSGAGWVLAPDPERVGIVAELARRALAGEAVHSLARWLDGQPEATRRTHRGRKPENLWSEAAVEAILRNPTLAGLTPYAPGRKPGQPAEDWAVLRDADGVPVENPALAVISVEERGRLLAVLDAAKRPGSRSGAKRPRALLSGVAMCAGCGRRLHSAVSAGRDVYTCSPRRGACDARTSVVRERLDAFVIAEVLRERADVGRYEFRTVTPDASALAPVERALEEAGLELARARTEAEADAITRRMARLRARRAELAEAQARKPVVVPVGSVTWGEEFAEALDAGDVDAQRRLLAEQVESVTVSRTGQRTAPIAERVGIDYKPEADNYAA